MKKNAILLALAVLASASIVGAGESQAAAKSGGGCKSSPWSLSVPAGSGTASATIVQAPEDHIWRVGVGRVPQDAMLVIEYESVKGLKGELVLQSGAAQFVEGSSVTMRLQRDAKGGKLAIAGTYQIKCGKQRL